MEAPAGECREKAGREPTVQSQPKNPQRESLDRLQNPPPPSLKELELLLPGGRFHFLFGVVPHLLEGRPKIGAARRLSSLVVA